MSDFVEQLREVAAASLLPEDGELTAPGPRRTGRGPAAIAGACRTSAPPRSSDLWFAQGFITAGERLFQIDLLLRAASGRLSEVFADRTLDDDRFARTIGFHRTGETLAAGWDDVSTRCTPGSARGARRGSRRCRRLPVEYTLLDMTPELPTDDAGAWAAAFVYLAWGLSGNWDKELLRTAIAERLGDDAVRTLLPPLPLDPPHIPAGTLGGRLLDDAPASQGRGLERLGRVAGSRTTTGKPLLANDPHLLAVQPGAWIEMHLRAPGYEARGVALTFSPGILLGTTAHHAWGVTNVSGDVQDLYVEHLNEDGPRPSISARGSRSRSTTRRSTSAGRPNPSSWTFARRATARSSTPPSPGDMHTEYFPLPETATYALRWTGLECGIRPSLVLDAAQATELRGVPPRPCGASSVPARTSCTPTSTARSATSAPAGTPSVARATAPCPCRAGPTSTSGTGGSRSTSCRGRSIPARGYLVTANNRIHDDAYPHLIGHDFHAPYRARRIVERLEAVALHDVASMGADPIGHGVPPRARRAPVAARAGADDRRRA